MSVPFDLGFGGPALALGLAALLLALGLWLAWRFPTATFLIALASLAIRPQLLWGGPDVGYGWGLHQTLIALALAVNALRFGVRATINWPILALIASFLLGLVFGDLHPRLTLPFMLQSLTIFALPFAFTQVPLEPGSRRSYALLIMLLPPLSVALGGMLQLADLRTVFSYERWVENWYRLEGATGNPAVFATLAFAGFAVALHEWTRPGRSYAGYLASLNLGLIILSGARMAMFAGAVLVATYAWRSSKLRERLRHQRRQALLGAGLVAVALITYAPTLHSRMFKGATGDVDLSGRDAIWAFYWTEFLFSPLFGRGFGSGFVAAADWVPWPRKTPHNEYLHLLVTGGAVGFALCAAAITWWYLWLLRSVPRNDRDLLIALIPAMAAFAVTEDVLVFSSALALYAYLGILLTRPSERPVLPSSEPSGEPGSGRPTRQVGPAAGGR